MMDFILIVAGFILLIFGANTLVDGSVGLAKKLKISDLIIGLTIVAFGTSTPELVINLVAVGKHGSTDIAFTNIIGSNMINVFIVLGAAAVIFPITSQKSSRRFDIPLSILAPVLLLLLTANGVLTRIDGLVLMLFFLWFLHTTIRNAVKFPEKEQTGDFKPMKIWKAVVFIIGGLAILIVGARLIVPSAVNVATKLGVSEAVIGLTIVALGTSLPELATSVVAAFKKNSDIALGNVIGSNILNIFFILSTSAIIKPLPVYPNITTDLIVTTLGNLLVIFFIFSNKERTIKRWAGALFLIIYGVFLGLRIATIL